MDVKLSGSPEGPLKGIRVIDITSMITGPLCAQQLGDLGADVIKIEPTHGEIARWMAPPQKAGLTGFYAQMNRNKRSLSRRPEKSRGHCHHQKAGGNAPTSWWRIFAAACRTGWVSAMTTCAHSMTG